MVLLGVTKSGLKETTGTFKQKPLDKRKLFTSLANNWWDGASIRLLINKDSWKES
jgi:hypothetical protein